MSYAEDLLKDIMDEPELTLPILRKKYIGKQVNIEKLPEYECYFDEKALELQWEYTYMCSWSGDEYSYEATVKLKPDMTISRIGALHCMRYCGADATSSGYRGKRADDFDYSIFERRLKHILQDEE